MPEIVLNVNAQLPENLIFRPLPILFLASRLAVVFSVKIFPIF